MKMDLTLSERVDIIELLKPMEGNILLLKEVRKAISDIGVTAEDRKECDIVEKNGVAKWDPDKAGVVLHEFEFGESVFSSLKTRFTVMNSQNKLTQKYFTLYEKFVDPGIEAKKGEETTEEKKEDAK